MAQNYKLSDVLQSIQNSQIRIALEQMMLIAGVDLNDRVDDPIEKNITGDVEGGVTGNVTGDVTGSIDGAIVDGDTLITKTLTPVNALEASGTLTSSGALVPAKHGGSTLTNDTTNIEADKIITIGSTVYTFKADPTGIAYAVDIGSDAEDSAANLAAAINADGTDDDEYGAGTVAHPDFYAASSDATTVVIVARVPDDANNADVTESDDAGWTWTGADIANGVAGVTDDGATLTIGTRTYMFVNELSETSGATAIVDQILYGGSEAVALDNLKVAINAGATAGTNYSTGTVVNADVTAGTNTNTTQLFTAKVAGTVGNAIATTETLANTVFGAETLTGGVDGTVGSKGQIEWDASFIYVAVLANTTADKNWEKVPIASYTAAADDNLVTNITGTASKLVSGTNPVNAVNAAGVLTWDTFATIGDTITIGTRTYTFVADGTKSSDGEIDIGAATAADSQAEILAAIDGSDGNSAANTDVVMSAFDAADACDVIAITPGVAGDLIATTESTNAATNKFTAVTLGSGVDGTVGAAGTVIIDDGFMHILEDANTIAGKNWKKLAMSSFGAAEYQTVDSVIDLDEGDFDSDVILLDGTAACTITDWTPTVGRTYIFQCIESTNDPVLNLTAGITLNAGGDDIMTFGDAEDTVTMKCISATRLVIINNSGATASGA